MRLRAVFLATLLALIARVAVAAPAIDGVAAFNACGSGNPLTISTTLTTTQANDAVIVIITYGNTPTYGYSVTDTAGLSYTLRNRIAATSITSDRWEEWFAPAASVLSGDVITFTAQSNGGSNCVKIEAFAISGAAWPMPFDPYYGLPQNSLNSSIGFTTLGTDDLLLAHYGVNGCTPTSSAPWTTLYSVAGSDLTEYLVVSGAQSGTAAPVSCPGNVQTFTADAFAAADGLGAATMMGKAIGYVMVQPGSLMSKSVGYLMLQPSTGMSKSLGYIMVKPAPGPLGSGLSLFHAFPP